MTKQSMLDETGKLRPEVARRAGFIGGILGAIIWGFFAVLASVMLVSMGAWAWVVWPFAFYWYINHLGRAVKAYKQVTEPKKWEQNVTINVPSEPSAAKIADAASRAYAEDLTGYRLELSTER